MGRSGFGAARTDGETGLVPHCLRLRGAGLGPRDAPWEHQQPQPAQVARDDEFGAVLRIRKRGEII